MKMEDNIEIPDFSFRKYNDFYVMFEDEDGDRLELINSVTFQIAYYLNNTETVDKNKFENLLEEIKETSLTLGYEGVIDMFLTHENNHMSTLNYICVFQNYDEILDICMNYGMNCNILFFYSTKHTTDNVFRYALSRGANPNYPFNDMFPYSYSYRLETLKLLVDNGADLSLYSSKTNIAEVIFESFEELTPALFEKNIDYLLDIINDVILKKISVFAFENFRFDGTIGQYLLYKSMYSGEMYTSLKKRGFEVNATVICMSLICYYGKHAEIIKHICKFHKEDIEYLSMVEILLKSLCPTITHPTKKKVYKHIADTIYYTVRITQTKNLSLVFRMFSA